MGDDKVSDDIFTFLHGNGEEDEQDKAPMKSSTSSMNPTDFDSSVSDLLNLEGIDSSNPFLADIPVPNAPRDGSSDQPDTPKVYVAPRAAISHQDSFPTDSRVDQIEDARISIESPRQGRSPLPRLRVLGSARALVYPRAPVSPRFGSPTSSETPKIIGVIDTTAPFESVKQEVSKFGGITDWKAHKIQTIERRKLVDQELEKTQEDIPEYKKQAELAEEAKQKVQKELEDTKKLIEELKLELEKAQKEEQQAKQDTELAKLRVEEMEQGIAEEASVAAKAQLEVAKARLSSAISELKSVREEIRLVSKEYEDLLKEKDLAAKKAEDARLEAKEIERKMEGLTIELMATKELLESAHTAHLEAEEKRFGAAMARDRDIYNWEKELKMVEDDIERLNQEIHATEDEKAKLETASSLLRDLRGELVAASMENPDLCGEEVSNGDPLMRKSGQSYIQTAVLSAKKELEEVKSNIENATSEVKTLKIIVASLQSELEREKKTLEEMKQGDNKLEQISSDVSSIQTKDKEAREELAEIAKKLQQAAGEAEEAKSLAEAARDELRKAKEESIQAKGGVRTIENRLMEAKKEMEAARASEKLALAAIKALQESECAQRFEGINSPRSIIISVEEYYELSKRAHEAEEAANIRLAEIVAQIKVAKEEESRILEKLEEVNREMALRKEELKVAMEKAEKAREGKLGVEQQLRKWWSENGKKRKEEVKVELERSPRSSTEWRHKDYGFNQLTEAPRSPHKPGPEAPSEQETAETEDNNSMVPETKKKKKKFSLLPKVFMFLSRKKSDK
ncbi:PREDICTED: protein WEAK CHLOROPLAST MOVEMENT UNDER BLUE LIGHT-like 3 [Tarenaya hassleriana]|uniref:protein WEAK CHLOROPLAST MOVEMENT UNDER BLUE LIGHT-like 3 n=1 Tax=Tarenaya hassleriana TaxID=28532 RepID=UPI00053C9DA5|nr:PREDICTED: protein WEAK CHLOROPLAST MOVEMENT UNDER BLUE LIGHT-like 3 [Tarenaya hassleriana]XP_010538126.1 PREDICTED: protein WEAK CHLOROPLAST MOVEMENT UNDER BLUE LIGHT-like 3 [Tarenaya hassleriana]